MRGLNRIGISISSKMSAVRLHDEWRHTVNSITSEEQLA